MPFFINGLGLQGRFFSHRYKGIDGFFSALISSSVACVDLVAEISLETKEVVTLNGFMG